MFEHTDQEALEIYRASIIDGPHRCEYKLLFVNFDMVPTCIYCGWTSFMNEQIEVLLNGK